MKRGRQFLNFILVSGIIISCADKKDTTNQLFAKLQNIPLVDSHCHVRLPEEIQNNYKKADFKYDVKYVLNQTTYVGEFLYGETWEETKRALEINQQHAFYRPILEAWRDLYGLPAGNELNEQNANGVSMQMDEAHRQEDWYAQVYAKANISHIIWLYDYNHKGKLVTSGPDYYPMWNIDRMLVYVTGKEESDKTADGSPYRIDRAMELLGEKVNSLDEMEKVIEVKIKEFFDNGGVGLKTTSAYYRALDFDTDVPKVQAEKVFNKVLAHQEVVGTEKKIIEDYLMVQVFNTVDSLKKPIQIHTGNQQQWNIVSNSDPLALNKLLYTGKWHNAKFVLLHGGYPFPEEEIMLTRQFKNVYMDLAWMSLYSPAAAKQTLSEAIDILDGRQLMFGTDAANLEEMYGTAKFTRRILADVLSDKIESGFLTEEAALSIARRILSTNAIELYGLQN